MVRQSRKTLHEWPLLHATVRAGVLITLSTILFACDAGNNISSRPTPPVTINQYTLTVTQDANALVVGDGIDCGTNCTASYKSGTQIQLNITPSAGYEFISWGGACSGADTCNLLMDTNQTVNSNLEPITPPSPTDITAQLDSIENRVILEWLSQPPEGQELTFSVTRNGELIAENLVDTSYTDTQIEASQLYSYQVTAVNQYQHKSSASDAVEINTTNKTEAYILTIARNENAVIMGDEINCGNECKAVYEKGAKVELTATPNTGYEFISWSGACQGWGVCTLNMVKDVTVGCTVAPIVPPTPMNLEANINQNSQAINLQWQAVNAQGQSVTFKVLRDHEVIASDLNDTNYTDNNIQAGATYRYQIQAINQFGHVSDLSYPADITTAGGTGDTTPPSAPANLTASSTKATSVALSWDASSDNTGGSGVAGYLLYRNDTFVKELPANETTYTDTGLVANTEYRYEITAFDGAEPANESGRSNAINITTSSTAINKDSLFASAVTIFDGPVTSVGWKDIDGDGDADMFAVEGGLHSCGNNCRLLAWFEAPNWQRHDLGDLLGPFTGDSALVDMDNDGDPDVVVSKDDHVTEANDDAVYWYENQNNGQNWVKHTIEFDVPNAFHIGELRVADIDGDGKKDVVIRHLSTYRFVIYFQNSAEDWTPVRIDTRPREGLGLVDLDQDGRVDILANGYVLFAPNDPRTGNWQEVTIDSAYYSQAVKSLNNSSKISAADMNKDGRLDLIISSAEGDAVQLAWYAAPSNPRSGAWTKHEIEQPQGNNHQVLPRDVDGDGDLDILGGFAFGDAGVHWWENVDGKGLTWQRRLINASLGCYNCLAVDYDKDGDIDLAGPRDYREEVYLYENTLKD